MLLSIDLNVPVVLGLPLPKHDLMAALLLLYGTVLTQWQEETRHKPQLVAYLCGYTARRATKGPSVLPKKNLPPATRLVLPHLARSCRGGL